MTPINKKGPGAPTHVLVDMLGHPAVELTQAEDAVGSGARADLAAPAAVSGSEDVLVLVVGILAGCASCAILMSIVCLVARRRTRLRRFSATPTRRGDDNGAIVTATTLSRTSGGKEVNVTTSVVTSKDAALGNGSIVGTTCSDYFGSPAQNSSSGIFSRGQSYKTFCGRN
jgi:hypothetical protein